jgi:hypothetical protein
MKKHLAFFTSLISFSAFAALPAAHDPTLVDVPVWPDGEYMVGLEFFGVQPTTADGDLTFATLVRNPNVLPPFLPRLVRENPSMGWGFGVDLGFIFKNTGNDINLSFHHFNTNDRKRIFTNPNDPQAFVLNSFIFPLITFGPDLNQANFFLVNNKSEFDLNRVDLTLGQYINVGCRLRLHPFIGASYAQLERDLITDFQGTAFTLPDEIPFNYFLTTDLQSEFRGIGPIIGADATYYVGYGFGLVGHILSSVLAGSTDNKLNIDVFTPGLPNIVSPQSFVVDFNSETNRRIAPTVEARLGADYTYMFHNQSYLTLEVGYRVSEYYNVIDHLRTSATSDNTSTFFIAQNQALSIFIPDTAVIHHTRDFGYHGAYVTLSYHGL